MTQRNSLILGTTVLAAFFLLTPLGIFNSWIPPDLHTGYYSVTTIDAGDDTGYYAFLRSVFFDGDLDFFNELKYVHSERLMPTGYVFNNWQMGQAILFFPFYIVGHLLALIYQSLGYPVPVNGYSAPYYIATAVASVTFLFAGLILVSKILESVIQKRFTLIVTLSIWLASPLLYFSFIRQRMAHTSEFFLSAVLIYAWVFFRATRVSVREPSKLVTRYILMGGLLGFLSMTRVINIVFFVLFAIDLLWTLRLDSKSGFPEKLKKYLMLGGAMLAGFLLIMLPQIICWYQLNGVPFPPRHMKFAGEGLSGISFISLFKNAWALFFDGKWGLVFSMPLAIVGLLGLLFKNEWLKETRPSLLAYLTGIFVIVLLYPEDSASYGHRHFISALPVFALGLANIFKRLAEIEFRWGLRFATCICFVAVLMQYFMVIHYKVTLPYNEPGFALKALGSTKELISIRPDLLLRSTNFLNLHFLSNASPWNYLDVLFLLVYPLFQLTGLVAAGVFLWWMDRQTGGNLKILEPRLVLGIGIGFSIFLLVTVLYSAPTKTESEIKVRLKYQERVKSGEAKLRRGNFKEAQADYLEASELFPQGWKPYLMIGQALMAQGNLKGANRYFHKVLVYNPEHSPTMMLLGNNLKRLDRQDEAEKMLRAAIRAWPMNLKAYDSLAQVLATKGEPREAAVLLNYAVKINPNYGPGHLNLAMTYHSLGQEKKSEAHFNRAVSLGMQGPVVDQIRALIFKGGN